MGLFDDETTHAAAPAPAVNVPDVVAGLWKQVENRDPLPETINAFGRLPGAIRYEVEVVAAAMFQDEFNRIATAHALETNRAAKSSMSMMVNGAKLMVLSSIGYFAGNPWHLADPAMLKRIAADLQSSKSLASANKHMDSIQCVNLFVAALENDSRESYLKSVKGLARRHPVRNIVLDAELIEWRPEAEFLAAANEIGIRPLFIGIADRKTAHSHGMLKLDSTPQRTPALYVDTQGNQLAVSESGEVILLETVKPKRVAQTPPVERNTQTKPAPELLQATAPPSAMQARIQALRENQARRAVRP